MSKTEDLQQQWNYLYREYLPALAKAKDPAQEKWPVFLDHCFARVILDNAVGIDRPWTEVIKQPAVRNMSADQLRAAIDLGRQIADGSESLVTLNDSSLEKRNTKRTHADEVKSALPKKAGKRSAEFENASPRKAQKRRDDGVISAYFKSPPQSKPNRPGREGGDNVTDDANDSFTIKDEEVDMEVQVQRIKNSHITDFRKQTLILLCQIPRGRFSTYQAMSDHITKTSHNTCARAVGNAMRNNPFAPEVPCHRVLASDRSLGGFKGDWGETGKYAGDKHRLLHEEGVRFDSQGKVKGPPFREFKE